jgi:UMF1 family MFS transporter
MFHSSNAVLPKDHPRLTNAWCSYDLANSVYNLTITATIFPVYYSASTRAAFGSDMVNFLGVTVKNSVLYTFAISFSFLVVVFLAPVLSGIADYSGRKTRFMRFFTYMGALSCISLFWFTGENVAYGIFFAILASIGYAGALVFYNAFLPEIASEMQMNRVSARGFSMGYIGSVVLLIINLLVITFHEQLGLPSAAMATRIAFLTVGIWWFGFSHIAFHYLRDVPTHAQINRNMLGKGFQEIKNVLATLRVKPNTIRFLLSFFFYSMGVQTVMLLAPLFGEQEVGMDGQKLILVVLILQVVAIAGASLFAWLSDRIGNRMAIMVMLVCWMWVCVGGYFLEQEQQFYLLAALLGFVMGGIQSVSRSTFSKLIPETARNTASYFSFYDITEKIAIVLGTFSYGLIEQLTGSMRNSLLAMIAFFLGGFLVLAFTRMTKETRKA